jgi:hypothetical protein
LGGEVMISTPMTSGRPIRPWGIADDLAMSAMINGISGLDVNSDLSDVLAAQTLSVYSVVREERARELI